jgi:hypothetical protein
MKKENLKKLKGPSGGRLKYFYPNGRTLKNIEMISKEMAGYRIMFFRAKNEEEIKKHITQEEGECVFWHDFSNFLEGITKGERTTFLAGDPMRFEGVIRGVVQIIKQNFLEVEITPELFAYFMTDDDYINCIKKA